MNRFVMILIVILSGCNSFQYPAHMKQDSQIYSALLGFSKYKIMGIEECTDFSLTIKNKSKSTLKILWNDSAIVKDGKSSSIIPEGTRFIKGNEEKQNTIVPANLEIITSFTPSSNVNWSTSTNTWQKRLLTDGHYVVLLVIETGEGNKNCKFDFNITSK